MTADRSFPLQIGTALTVLTALAAYPVLRYCSPDTIRAITAGGILATFNVLLGYAAIRYAFGRSTTVFFRWVIGGMGIRMALLAGILLLLIGVFRFDPLALVGSLGVCYIVFLVLEIMFIQQKVSTQQ